MQQGETRVTLKNVVLHDILKAKLVWHDIWRRKPKGANNVVLHDILKARLPCYTTFSGCRHENLYIALELAKTRNIFTQQLKLGIKLGFVLRFFSTDAAAHINLFFILCSLFFILWILISIPITNLLIKFCFLFFCNKLIWFALQFYSCFNYLVEMMFA